ncbi:MAG: hypothetical protein M3Z20_19930, partial [Chloroflexota bacterium]|nr:hypothetical protein [Chloroflexota bacterium]
PAYLTIVLREYFPWQQNRRAIVGWLLLPPVLFAVGVGCLFAVYQLRFGHGPDVQAYVEVVLSFGGSRVGQTSGLFEATDFAETALVIVFGVVLFALAAAMLARSNAWRDLPLALGLLFGMWALLAHPVSQPFLFALYRILPFLLLGMAIILASTSHNGVSRHTDWTSLLRMMVVPVLTAILVTAYANLPEIVYYTHAIRDEPFLGRDVTAGLPSVEPSLQQLLTAADVRPTDLLFYEGTTYGEMLPVWQPLGEPPVIVSKQWLAGPLSAMVYLSDDRKQTYLARSADRQRGGGWLVEPRNRERLQFSLGPWFFEQVNRTHIPTKFASNDEWQLIWFEPRRADAGLENPLHAVEWGPESTEDIRINGEKLTSMVLPAVWGAWGPEWIRGAAGQPGRCVAGKGTLRVFSSSPRRVALKLKRTGLTSPPLTIRVNDSGRARQGADLDAATVSLKAGWNTIRIALANEESNEKIGPVSAESCDAGTFAHGVLQVDRIDIRTK